MPDQPLRPFAPPSALLAHFPGTIAPGLFVEWISFVVFAFWAFYTLIVIYHWLKYSHASVITFPAIIAHLGISFALISYALFGTFSL